MNLVGQRFGKLLVKGRAPNSKHGKSRWHCICDCGTNSIHLGCILHRGDARSCGCGLVITAVENFLKHGHAGTRTYRIWSAMKTRCRNPRAKAFRHYGGRGIAVCESWLEFENFLADMGPAPDGLSIDRIANDGHYEPGNCRWATPKQQSQNSSIPKVLTFKNETMNVSEWARHLGINPATLQERLGKWPLERALSTKKSTRWSRRPHPVTE